MAFFCNCEDRCHGVRTEVSRATYYRHAPFRLNNLIQPVDPALVAAHFTLVPERDPHPELEADDSDIVMNEVCYLIVFLNFLYIVMIMHAIS